MSLPFFNVGPFGFSNERKKLQDEICNKLPDQSTGFVRRIKERHVEDADIHAFDFDEDSPLFKDILIVPAETVDALDVEQVVFFHAPNEAAVLRAVKILAGLLVHKDVCLRDAHLAHGDHLAILVLFSGAHAHIAVGIAHGGSSVGSWCSPFSNEFENIAIAGMMLHHIIPAIAIIVYSVYLGKYHRKYQLMTLP